MQISKEADYALRAVLYLARLADHQQASTGTIAASEHIPVSFLAKIVARLSSARIIRTSRGARGGVSLDRPSEQITVLDVIEAIDGPIAIKECVLHSGRCPYGENCTLQPILCEAQAALVTRLQQTTFDQLI